MRCGIYSINKYSQGNIKITKSAHAFLSQWQLSQELSEVWRGRCHLTFWPFFLSFPSQEEEALPASPVWASPFYSSSPPFSAGDVSHSPQGKTSLTHLPGSQQGGSSSALTLLPNHHLFFLLRARGLREGNVPALPCPA